MKHSKWGIGGGLLALVLTLPSLGAPAKLSVEFGGLTHTALGSAILEIVDDNLVVSNIGPGGLEGVFVDLDQADSFRMAWQDLDQTGANANTLLQFFTTGSTSGQPSADLSWLFVGSVQRDLPSPALVIEVDFGDLNANAVTFEVYDDGERVEAQTAEVGFIVAFLAAGATRLWPTAVTKVVGEDRRAGYHIEWGGLDSELAFSFRNRDDLQARGNELRVLAADGDPVNFLTGFEVRVGDLDTFAILGEGVVNAP